VASTHDPDLNALPDPFLRALVQPSLGLKVLSSFLKIRSLDPLKTGLVDATHAAAHVRPIPHTPATLTALSVLFVIGSCSCSEQKTADS